MCKVLLPVHAQQGALLAFNQLFSPLVVLWWLRAAIGCSCGAMLYALGRWCAQQCCWVVSTLRTVLLPVHAQHGGLLAFDQLFGPILMSWWLCALIGCSCGALLAVVAPYCSCLGSNGCLVLLSSKA